MASPTATTVLAMAQVQSPLPQMGGQFSHWPLPESAAVTASRHRLQRELLKTSQVLLLPPPVSSHLMQAHKALCHAPKPILPDLLSPSLSSATLSFFLNTPLPLDLLCFVCNALNYEDGLHTFKCCHLNKALPICNLILSCDAFY